MTVSKKKSLAGILVTAVLILAVIAAATFHSDALTGMEASGYVSSASGAVLRGSASTKGAKVAVLKRYSPVTIHMEVFTNKKKSGKTYRWYYVTTGAGNGYMRADTVAVSSYGGALGKTTKKITVRAGAGKKMKKKGTIKKKKNFAIVLEAKAKGSSKRWYKIKKGSKYYYVCSSGTKIYNLTSGVPEADINTAAQTVQQSAAAINVVNNACAWAVNIAGDDRFHYGKKPNSQHNGCYFCGTQMLSGGRSKEGVVDYEFSYCCNPFVHAAFAHGGNELTMLEVCKKGSSYDYKANRGYDTSPLFAKLGKPAMQYLRKGDVICWSNHVVLYLGGGKIVESTGGDDNVRNSDKWNNSIRVCTLTESRYASAQRTYRYTGNVQ